MSVRRRSSIFPFSILFLAVVFGATPVLAQQSTAAPRVTVTGTVADTSGAVLPGTTVEALADGKTVATTTTGPEGRYRIELPAGGQYQLRVRREKFAEQTGELRTTSTDTTRDIVLGIAAVADTVVVTASRLLESRATTTGSISVFTANDIAALGSNSIAEVIRFVPGLNVESTGREGALTSLFSRGGESDYNLVLIDGVRVNNNGGQFDFSRIAGAEIDRVEVVRGAQSALYGSYAIGSVVQIFTRRAGAADKPQLSGSLEGGSFNTWRGDVGLLGGARDRVDYNASVAYRGSDGAFGDILSEKDRFDQIAFNGGGGVAFGNATLRSGVRYSNARGRSVGPIAYRVFDTGTAYETEDLSWHADFTQRLTSRLNHAASARYFRNDLVSADQIVDRNSVFTVLEGRPGAIFPDGPRLVRLVDEATFNALRAGSQPLGPGQFLASTAFGVFDSVFRFESKLRRPMVRYQADLTWFDDQILSAGYDYERETDPRDPAIRFQNHAYFVQQQFKLQDRWFATVGGRLDDNTRFGTEFSPKLSVGGFLLPFASGPVSSVKVFANIGRGIKNPTFSELFGGSTFDGNPDLHPERARTVDAGAELTFDSQRWLARVAYFDNSYKDQVAFRSTGFGRDNRPDFLNIDGSKANGWELEAGLQRPVVGGLTASGGYAFVDTKVVTFISTSEQFQPGQPLLRRPKHSGTFRLTYARGRTAVNFNLRRVGRRHDSSFLFMSSPQFPEGGSSIDIRVNPGYTLVALGGDVRVHNDLTLFVRIDNLADEKYESALGFPGLPRAAVVGGRFSIGR